MIMRASTIDAFTGKFVEEYSRYAVMVLGEASRLMYGREILNDEAVFEANRRIDAIGSDYYFVTDTIASKAVFDVMWFAISTFIREGNVRTPETFSDLMERSLDDYRRRMIQHITGALRSAALRDAQTFRKYFSDFRVRVAGEQALRGVSFDKAIKTIKNSFGTPEMNIVDAAGRRWKGERFVETLVNRALFSVYNEVYIYAAAMTGIERLYVYYPSSTHRYHGDVFCVSPEQDCPNYDNLKEKVFHPRSKALVTASKVDKP